MEDNKQFDAELTDLGVPPHIIQWLKGQMAWYDYDVPRVDHRSRVDPDEVYEKLVEGTVETCMYRPSLDDIRAAVEDRTMSMFIDYAHVLSFLWNRRPASEGLIWPLSEENRSASSKELWAVLQHYPADAYNDRFAIRCFSDIRLLKRVSSPSNRLEKMSNVLGASFLWRNARRVDSHLKRHSYHFTKSPRALSLSGKVGDIIKVAKKTRYESFISYAIVSGDTDEQIKYLEFKYGICSPFQSSIEGFQNFFLRDPETVIDGVWEV